jgi:hypothetical protein
MPSIVLARDLRDGLLGRDPLAKLGVVVLGPTGAVGWSAQSLLISNSPKKPM